MPTFEISLSDGRKFHVDAANQETAQADLLKHISQPAPDAGGGVADAAKAGLGGLLSGVGETGQRYLGVGKALSDAGNSITPQNAPDTTLYDDKGFHAENIPNALAENAPGVAAAIAAARLTPGPLLAKLLAAGGVGLASTMGNFAKDATAKRTGDANAPSNTQDLWSGAERALPEAAIQALPIGRFLPTSAARLGLKGVVGSLGRTAADAAGMGAASAGANAYDQLNQTGAVDPTQAIDAAARGAVTGGAFGAGRTLQDAKAAVKFRGISGEDPTHISEAANRVIASNQNLDGNLNNPSDGGDAIRSAQTDVATEFKAAVDAIKGSGEDKNVLSQDAQSALARAQAGLPISDADAAALTHSSGEPGAVADLQRLSGVARVLQGAKETGYQNADGSLTGGMSGAMGSHMRAFTNPVGVGVAAGLGLGHLGDVVSYSPHGFAALGGAYGLARALDWATGNRSPAAAFAKRFATNEPIPTVAPTQIGTGAGQQVLAQMANRPGPTGPSVPLTQPWASQQQAPPQVDRPGPTGPEVPLNQPWSAPPQAAQPQQPDFNPVAMAMLKKAMLNVPQAPQPAPAEAPQSPQLSPVAMRMLAQQMKTPPAAPQEPAPEAPQLPQFNPVAMAMLKAKLANPPQAPVAPVAAPAPAPVSALPPEAASPAALVPAITKLTKSANGKVKVETKPSETAPQEPAAPPAQPEEDLSIPDFLRRTPVTDTARAAAEGTHFGNVQPTVTDKHIALEAKTRFGNPDNQQAFVDAYKQAAQAKAKLNGKGPVDLQGEVDHPPEELAMSPKAFSEHRIAQYTPEERAKMGDKEEVTRASIERKVQWKVDVATKLAAMFPDVGDQKTFYAKLFATHRAMPIRQLRDALAGKYPDKAKEVQDMLSNDKLRRIWNRVN